MLGKGGQGRSGLYHALVTVPTAPRAAALGRPAKSNVAVTVSGLTKQYRIRHKSEASTTAAEAIVRGLRSRRRNGTVENFTALDDVSFEVEHGEVLGIVGRNGAGKSTLLKILTRVTAPTAGRVVLAGPVGSLLEVGTGFHPELTGRENVFLNGTLLGMRRREVQRRFDEIVEFAGVEKFLDTQVKRFSTGMYVRLAFSVAAHLETDILAIDEVLAVGDADFQDKCLRKVSDVASSGRTALIVSHQIQTVRSMCTSAMYLDRGHLRYYGSVDGALAEYKASFQGTESASRDAGRRAGSGEVRFTRVECSSTVYEVAEPKVVHLKLQRFEDLVGRYYLYCLIRDHSGVVVAQCDSRLDGFWLDPADEEIEASVTISSPWLKPGSYTVDVRAVGVGRALDVYEGAYEFQVVPVFPYAAPSTPGATDKAVVVTDFGFERR